MEFGSFVLRIEDKIIKLQIWDTAGQESFKSITKIFYRGAHCVFLTYDITREETFTNLSDWLKEVKIQSGPEVFLFLVGNQLDRQADREVVPEKAQQYMKEEGLHYFVETSAKTPINVEKVFVDAAKRLYVYYKDRLDTIAQNESKERAKPPQTLRFACTAMQMTAI